MEEMKTRAESPEPTPKEPIGEAEVMGNGELPEDLTPPAPPSASREGGVDTGDTPSPFTERGQGGEVHSLYLVEKEQGVRATDDHSANGTTAQTTESEVIEPRPAPLMDWKRFGPPITILGVLTIALLLAIQFMPRGVPKAEGQTLNKVPTVLGDWNLLQEYSVGEAALRELQPDEYLARIYVNPQGEQADLSIIAGSHTGAFHSPQVCFRVQNWEFADNREITLNVPGLSEPLKARYVELVSLRGDNQRAVGIYFYSTPFGYRSDTSSARIYLLAARLAGMNSRSYFVRFLKPASGNPERDEESIKQFAESALAEMVKTNPEVVR